MVQEPTSMILDKKRVRFGSIEVFEVMSREDISREEHLARSFTDEELIQIRTRKKHLSKQMSSMGMVEDVNEDMLGLETEEEKFRRRRRRSEAQMSVLIEQEFQSDTDEEDPYFLSRVYEGYTRESARLAHNRALSNAVQVQNNFWCDLSCNISCLLSPFLRPAPSRWEERTAKDYVLVPALNQNVSPQFHRPSNMRSPNPWDQWANYVSESEGVPMRAQ
jgi:hypothetical protein